MSKVERSSKGILVRPIDLNILAQRIASLISPLRDLNQKADSLLKGVNNLSSINEEILRRLQGELECIHINGEVGTSPIAVWDVEPVVTFFVHNTHDTNDLLVSFDGTRFKTISAGDALSISGWPTHRIKFENGVKVKGSADGTTYEILVLR